MFLLTGRIRFNDGKIPENVGENEGPCLNKKCMFLVSDSLQE